MPSKLVIDLDSLDSAKAQVFAGILLAFVGCEVQTSDVDPVILFGPVAPVPPVVDTTAPHVEIPCVLTVTEPTLPLEVGMIITESGKPNKIVTGIAMGSANLDKAGLPWDGRIHASTKATNADGTWRLKRGVSDLTVQSVTAELKRALGASATGPQLVPAPPAPVAVPPPPPNTPDPATFEQHQKYIELIGRACAAVGAGKVSQDQLNKCLSALGIENMPMLGHRLDLVAAASSLIDGIVAGQTA